MDDEGILSKRGTGRLVGVFVKTVDVQILEGIAKTTVNIGRKADLFLVKIKVQTVVAACISSTLHTEIGIAVETWSPVFFQDNIDHARIARCFVFGGRIGHDFNLFDGACGQGLEVVFQLSARQVSWFVVDEHGHSGAALKRDHPILVYCDAGCTFQCLQGVATRIGQQGIYIDNGAVDFALDVRCFGSHSHLLELFDAFLQLNAGKLKGCSLALYHQFFPTVFGITQQVSFEEISACGNAGKYKTTILIRVNRFEDRGVR